MKKIVALLLVVICFFSCTGKTAIGYNDTIIKPQLEVVALLDSMFTKEVSYPNIQKYRESLIGVSDRALTQIKKLEDYKGNTSFRMAGIKYFTFVSNYFLTTPNVDSLIYNSNSPERFETIPEDVFKKLQADFNHFLVLEKELLDEQQKFANEFQINLK